MGDIFNECNVSMVEFDKQQQSGDCALRRIPCRHLRSPHGDVAIHRVQLHREAAPPSAFGGDDLGAGTAERLIDQVIGIRERRQHRLDQRHLEYCRV